MKIALVRREFRPHRGGAELYGNLLAASLVDAGHEVHLYASQVDDTLPPGVVHHGVRSIEWWSPLKRWTFVRSAQRAIPAGAYDVVQALEPYYPCDVFQAGDGFHRHWLTLPEARSSWLTPQHPVKLAIERRMLAPGRFRRVIAPCEMVKRHATRFYRVPPDRIDVVVPPIDVARFAKPRDAGPLRARLGLAPDDVALLFVGLNYRRKGLATVFEALARLSDPAFKLVVVGRDRDRSFPRRARELGLADRVRFEGLVADVEDYYAAADVLVLPALYDPFGMVVAEAMASGRVTVTTRTTGASEMIWHGESGFVLSDGRDAEGLAEILRGLRDPERRARVGMLAAAAVRDLTPDRHAQRMLDVYERVAAERTARRAPSAARPLEVDALGEVEVSAAFRELLRKGRVETFEDVDALPIARTLHRVRRDRRTDLVEIEGWPVVRKTYAGEGGDARDEWRALLAVAREGIRAPVPIAVAARGRRSAVLMGYVDDEEQLDHWGARALSELSGPARARRKRDVILALAREVRRFHEKGFTHRDLYLCHVWVREHPLRLRFMDLHRVERHDVPPPRRIVKDLAALHFSASRWVRPSRADELRFLRAYLDVPRLHPEHLRLARAVRRKSARMARHNRGREI